MRRDPSSAQRRRLMAANAQMCCVCKAFGVGLELHHIDGDNATTVDGHLAVLCVSDHDAHHRPGAYPLRHTELSAAEILRRKREWEAFVREARRPVPRLMATISMFGNDEAIHSVKAAYQWTDGRLVFERVYHLHSGTVDEWTTDIVDENVRLGRNIPLVCLSEPLAVEHCPCCRRHSLSNVIDGGYGLRLAAPNWDRDSSGAMYINPRQPSLALHFYLENKQVFSGHLHLCRGSHLHFTCDDYDERQPVKRHPSVRTQATGLVENLLRDWRPARLFIGTGDHDRPHPIEEIRLPRCWESRRSFHRDR